MLAPISVTDSLVVSTALFVIGIVGIFLNRRNLIVVLMSMELMLLAINTNFLIFSQHYQHLHGQVFVFFILAVAAAESAIGLAILVAMFRTIKSIEMDDINRLRG